MTVKLALIGAGVIGQRHLRSMAITNRVSLSAIVDTAAAAGQIARDLDVPHFADTQTLLQNMHVDGAIVATPTEHHLTPSLCALSHGVHLLIEKPITSTVEEAAQIAKVAESAGLQVLVGHQRRHYDMVAKAREVITSGQIGQLVAVSGLWCLRKHDAYYAADWRRKWQAGPILTNLIHEIDCLRHICGPITSVLAEVGNPVQGFEKEDVAAMVLRFESGALGTFILSDQADGPWAWEFATGENDALPSTDQNCLKFIGTKGALDFPNLTLWQSDDPEPSWTSSKSSLDLPTEFGDPYVRQLDHFADIIEGIAKPIVSAKDATESLRATLAVLDAARTGRRVSLT